MRLPEFLTKISPVGETLEAIGAGEAAMAEAVAERNKQFYVAEADTGLSLWEADYSLPDRTGGDPAARRLDIRAAMAGGRTLTPAYLAELAVTLGGADQGVVIEEFPDWRVILTAIAQERIPGDTGPLLRAVERLKPAHLEVLVDPEGRLSGKRIRYTALTGGTFAQWQGDDIARTKSICAVALTGAILVEVWG